MIAYTILENLWRLNRIFCSSDYDKSLAFLQTFLPFKIHEYTTDKPYKGWVIPPKWDLIRGTIKQKGKTLFEVDHPLKIMGLSSPFKGTLTLDELKKHLHYDLRDENAIPYHFRQHYRPWERDFGFCVTKKFYDSLKEGEYEVEIETEESPGTLKVAEYIKKGEFEEGFIFVAHLDHPGMANDDLSGVAVGVELFKKLSEIKTKFTYRLLIVQEIIGSQFYLGKSAKKPLIEAIFLEMLGNKNELSLQLSRLKKGQIEKTLLEEAPLKSGPFRSIICNDEVVFESYGIPMCSLSRYPYPEYHSNKDNLSIISKEALEEATNLLFNTVLKLDKKTLIHKTSKGVFSLANPKYNLYIDPGQAAFNHLKPNEMRALMDEIPLLPKYSFAESLAHDLQLPLNQIIDYLNQLNKKKLIIII